MGRKFLKKKKKRERFYVGNEKNKDFDRNAQSK